MPAFQHFSRNYSDYFSTERDAFSRERDIEYLNCFKKYTEKFQIVKTLKDNKLIR